MKPMKPLTEAQKADFNANPTPEAWIEMFEPIILDICEAYGIDFEDIKKLGEGKTYLEFADAFGLFVANAIHGKEDKGLN